MITTVLDTNKKELLANRAKEVMQSKETILQNVFYKLAPFHNRCDQVSEQFVGEYDKAYSVMLSDDQDGLTSIVLTWDIINDMGIDFIDVKKAAEENTPRRFPSTIEAITDVLAQLMKPQDNILGPITDVTCELYVISNKQKCLGAASICYPNMLKKISDMLDGGSFWILPSSVHELIVLRAEQATSDELRKMVKEINNTLLKPKDLLGYDVLFFDVRSGRLEIA